MQCKGKGGQRGGFCQGVDLAQGELIITSNSPVQLCLAETSQYYFLPKRDIELLHRYSSLFIPSSSLWVSVLCSQYLPNFTLPLTQGVTNNSVFEYYSNIWTEY